MRLSRFLALPVVAMLAVAPVALLSSPASAVPAPHGSPRQAPAAVTGALTPQQFYDLPSTIAWENKMDAYFAGNYEMIATFNQDEVTTITKVGKNVRIHKKYAKPTNGHLGYVMITDWKRTCSRWLIPGGYTSLPLDDRNAPWNCDRQPTDDIRQGEVDPYKIKNVLSSANNNGVTQVLPITATDSILSFTFYKPGTDDESATVTYTQTNPDSFTFHMSRPGETLLNSVMSASWNNEVFTTVTPINKLPHKRWVK